jgi:hypothetical protein
VLLPPAGVLRDGDVVVASTVHLQEALQSKHNLLQHVDIVWLSICSGHSCRALAPPCQRGCSALQQLVAVRAADRRCGLHLDPDPAVSVGCSGGCHCCIYTAFGGSEGRGCAMHTIWSIDPTLVKWASEPKMGLWCPCVQAMDWPMCWCVVLFW